MERKINYTINNTIISKVKLEEGTGELDFEMYDDILGSERVEKAYEADGVHTIDVGNERYYDQYPVKIEELEKFLEKAKKLGCNYIAIDYNCDHPDYHFFGIDVHVADKAEIKKLKDKDKASRLSEADKLRKQAESLIREADKLSKE